MTYKIGDELRGRGTGNVYKIHKIDIEYGGYITKVVKLGEKNEGYEINDEYYISIPENYDYLGQEEEEVL